RVDERHVRRLGAPRRTARPRGRDARAHRSERPRAAEVTPVPIALRYALRSDVGLVRSNNQDSGFAGPNGLVVPDGVGGHAGGEVASSVAVATFAPLNDDSFGADDAVAERERAVDEAQQARGGRSAAEPELSGMGTAVTALLRAGSMLAMA